MRAGTGTVVWLNGLGAGLQPQIFRFNSELHLKYGTIEFMKAPLDNFTTYADGTKVHPLTHVFFYLMAIYGLGLGFFGFTDSVKIIALYVASQKVFGTGVVSIWGILAILVMVVNTLVVAKKWTKYAPVAAMVGFCLWIYAVVVYATGAYWFQFLVVAIPNMFFWAWYYNKCKKVARNVKE